MVNINHYRQLFEHQVDNLKINIMNYILYLSPSFLYTLKITSNL